MPRSHYLAQCYLRRFATREDCKAIWQYKKSSGVLRKRGIKNVAQRTNYYSRILSDGNRDDRAEKYFGRLETRWPSLLGILNDVAQAIYSKSSSLSKSMTDADLTDLLHFMFIHSVRSPSKMKFLRAYVMAKHPRRDQLTDEEIQNYVVGGLIGTHDDVIEDWLRRMKAKGMNIFMLPAGSRLGFFTSDDPVFIGGDIREPSTLIVFSLDRKMVLALQHPGDTTALLIREKEEIDKVNVDIVANATDEIYSSEPTYLQEILGKAGLEVELRKTAS